MPEGFDIEDILEATRTPAPADVEWNPAQREALARVDSWLNTTTDQVFRLFGYAGTGKTTLAREIAKHVNGPVLFGAFTGKAALVLRQKGCPADTIHRMIYLPKDKSAVKLADLKTEYRHELGGDPCDEVKCRTLATKIAAEEKRLKQPAFSLNPDSEARHASLVIIDEVSMVGTRMAEDLLSFGVPVLALGDPAQLPPVGDGGFFTNAEPDFLLEDIHRQAQGSPIIELATRVRTGAGIDYGTFGTSAVVSKGTTKIEELAEFDQILCGRNATRHVINRRIREEVLGRTSKLPEPGDRLVCLRNNHELGLLNGSLWEVLDVTVFDEDELCLSVKGDDGQTVETVAHTAPFLGRELSFHDRRNADEFDFGLALTVHKSQGSQWPSVFIVDESGCFRQDAAKHLYTAITRAADRVTVAR